MAFSPFLERTRPEQKNARIHVLIKARIVDINDKLIWADHERLTSISQSFHKLRRT